MAQFGPGDLGECSPGPNGSRACVSGSRAARCELGERAVPQATANDLERHAEQLLQAAQDECAREQRSSALLLDAESERDVSRRSVGEHVDRMGKLVGPELAPFESPQRTRAAPDGERRLDRRRLEPLDVARDLGARLTDCLGAGRILAEQTARQALRAEVDRLRVARAGATAADDELRRAASDVDDGDDATGRRRRRVDRARERESSLFCSGEDTHRAPRRGLEQLREDVTVRRLAAGARDQDLEPVYPFGPGQVGVAPDDVGCQGELVGRDLTVRFDVGAEPEQRPLGADRLGCAPDDQAHRVRTDVDDSDGHGPMVAKPSDGASEHA